MKIIIVGLGTQGLKRLKFLKKYVVATVDPINKKANYKKINDVPINDYNSVFICTPDYNKFELINFCIKFSKHILIEKPLYFKNEKILQRINTQIIQKKNCIICCLQSQI